MRRLLLAQQRLFFLLLLFLSKLDCAMNKIKITATNKTLTRFSLFLVYDDGLRRSRPSSTTTTTKDASYHEIIIITLNNDVSSQLDYSSCTSRAPLVWAEISQESRNPLFFQVVDYVLVFYCYCYPFVFSSFFFVCALLELPFSLECTDCTHTRAHSGPDETMGTSESGRKRRILLCILVLAIMNLLSSTLHPCMHAYTSASPRACVYVCISKKGTNVKRENFFSSSSSSSSSYSFILNKKTEEAQSIDQKTWNFLFHFATWDDEEMMCVCILSLIFILLLKKKNGNKDPLPPPFSFHFQFLKLLFYCVK